MKVLAIVQARMGSTRLHGKVMREIAGKPMIGYILDSIALASEIDGVCVAAPARDVSGPLADYVLSRGVCFHASREDDDVAGRFLDALRGFPHYQAFLRICGDSPLVRARDMDLHAMMLKKGDPVVSNVGCKLVPSGRYIEGAHAAIYRAQYPLFTKEDREHAGFPYFYREWFKESALAVDTEDDFQRVSRIMCQF